ITKEKIGLHVFGDPIARRTLPPKALLSKTLNNLDDDPRFDLARAFIFASSIANRKSLKNEISLVPTFTNFKRILESTCLLVILFTISVESIGYNLLLTPIIACCFCISPVGSLIIKLITIIDGTSSFAF